MDRDDDCDRPQHVARPWSPRGSPDVFLAKAVIVDCHVVMVPRGADRSTSLSRLQTQGQRSAPGSPVRTQCRCRRRPPPRTADASAERKIQALSQCRWSRTGRKVNRNDLAPAEIIRRWATTQAGKGDRRAVWRAAHSLIRLRPLLGSYRSFEPLELCSDAGLDPFICPPGPTWRLVSLLPATVEEHQPRKHPPSPVSALNSDDV